MPINRSTAHHRFTRPVVPNAFVSGFGTLLDDEHRLLLTMTRAVESTEGPEANATEKILQSHRLKVTAIAGNLELIFQQLPFPTRFSALNSGFSGQTRTRGESFANDPKDPLDALIEGHGDLVHQLNALSDRGSELDRSGRETLLRAAGEHDEMGWMLTAIVNQKFSATSADRSSSDWPNTCEHRHV